MDKKISSKTSIAEKLTFRKETIEHKIDSFNLRKDRTRNTQFLWGILITFAVALFSTKVENIGTENQNIGQSLLILLLTSSALLTILKTIELLRMKDPIKKLKDSLYDSYINKPDLNVLFIIKRIYNGNPQILVMENKAWGCFFLPYIGVRDKTDDAIKYARKKIENILALKEDSTFTTRLLEHHEKTEKHHPQENIVKEYHSYYVHLKGKDSLTGTDFLEGSSFSRGNFDFSWKTFEEIESDPKTQLKNGDVLKVIREHCNDFIISSKCFIND